MQTKSQAFLLKVIISLLIFVMVFHMKYIYWLAAGDCCLAFSFQVMVVPGVKVMKYVHCIFNEIKMKREEGVTPSNNAFQWWAHIRIIVFSLWLWPFCFACASVRGNVFSVTYGVGPFFLLQNFPLRTFIVSWWNVFSISFHVKLVNEWTEWMWIDSHFMAPVSKNEILNLQSSSYHLWWACQNKNVGLKALSLPFV